MIKGSIDNNKKKLLLIGLQNSNSYSMSLENLILPSSVAVLGCIK
jgi:hypothetical protein